MTVKECYEIMGADYDDVMNRLRTDERVLKFLGKVADDKSMELLTASVESKNAEDAFRAAHTIKGISMNLSLRRLGASAEALTEALRGKTDFDPAQIAPLYAKLKEDYDQTIENIRLLQQSAV